MAKTVNESLQDFQVGHQIRLLRLSERESQNLGKILKRTDLELEKKLMRVRPWSRASKKRVAVLRKQVRDLMSAQAKRVRETMNEMVAKVADAEVTIQTQALNRVANTINLNVATVGLGTAVAAARGQPAIGTPVARMIQRFSEGDSFRTWSQISAGIVGGLTNQEITRSVIGTRRLLFRDGARAASRRGARALVRTVNSHVTTQAREAVWRANDDIVKEVQWISTLDGRTTPICQSLDGETFPVGEGRRPPAHIQCRSVTVPVLRDLPDLRNEVGATRASSLRTTPGDAAAWSGQVPAKLNYEEWLKRQPVGFQNSVLGPTRGRLFREGKVSLDRFVDAADKRLTIAQLRRQSPEAFKAAGLGAAPRKVTGVKVRGRTLPPVVGSFNPVRPRDTRRLYEQDAQGFMDSVEPALPGGAIHTPPGAPARVRQAKFLDLEKSVLEDYGGFSYKSINGRLRKPESFKVDEGRRVLIDGQIKVLDGAIKKTRMDRDAVVWRGIRLGTKDRAFADQFEPGFVFTEDGFASFSLDRQMAVDFSRGEGRKRIELMFRTKLLKGDNALLLSGRNSESELLLPRGLKFRVVDVDDDVLVVDLPGGKEERRKVVTMELIEDEGGD